MDPVNCNTFSQWWHAAKSNAVYAEAYGEYGSPQDLWENSKTCAHMFWLLRAIGYTNGPKLRLFAAACANRHKGLFGPAALWAVHIARRFAGGRVTDEELDAARAAVEKEKTERLTALADDWRGQMYRDAVYYAESSACHTLALFTDDPVWDAKEAEEAACHFAPSGKWEAKELRRRITWGEIAPLVAARFTDA